MLMRRRDAIALWEAVTRGQVFGWTRHLPLECGVCGVWCHTGEVVPIFPVSKVAEAVDRLLPRVPGHVVVAVTRPPMYSPDAGRAGSLLHKIIIAREGRALGVIEIGGPLDDLRGAAARGTDYADVEELIQQLSLRRQ